MVYKSNTCKIMAQVDRNIKRPCFGCGESVFLHPNIRRKDNPKLFEALDEPYQQDQKIVYHDCSARKQQKKESKYNYEPERLSNPDEVYASIKPVYDKEEKQKQVNKEAAQRYKEHLEMSIGVTPVNPTTKQMLKDIEFMKSEISDIKMLLQAVIKIFDLATRNSNKQGDSLLFKKASSMVDEERVNIEETKKITSETDNVDDDDGNVPSEESQEEALNEEQEEQKIKNEQEES
jgi:hypothetical protein